MHSRKIKEFLGGEINNNIGSDNEKLHRSENLLHLRYKPVMAMVAAGCHPLALHVIVISSSSVNIKWAEELENVGAAPFVYVRTV